MRNIFGYDGPFFSFLEKVSNIFWVNLLWLICSLPIFTIGASTTAMYYVTLKMVHDEDSYIAKSFFKSFKENFLQATAIWMVMLVAGAVLAYDYFITAGQTDMIYKVLRVATYIMSVVLALAFLYTFPLLAKFDNTSVNTVKNALLLSLANLPYTVIIALMYAVPFVLAYFVPQLIPVFVFMGVTGIAYFSSKMFRTIFDRCIVAKPEEVADDSDVITNEEADN